MEPPQPQYIQINGQTYQVPPGYQYVNGQIVPLPNPQMPGVGIPPSPSKQSHPVLITAIVIVGTLVLAAIVVLVLVLTGVLGPKVTNPQSGTTESSPITGLDKPGTNPKIVRLDNDRGDDFQFVGNYLITMDKDEIWAYDLRSDKEVWRQNLPEMTLDCEKNYGPSFGDYESRSTDYFLMQCYTGNSTVYAVISAKDGRVMTDGELGSYEDNSFVELLKDSSLLTCSEGTMVRYRGEASRDNELWSRDVDNCGYGIEQYDSGWLQQSMEGPWGTLYDVENGKETAAANVTDSLDDYNEDSLTFAPLDSGNFMVSYYVEESEESVISYTVMVDPHGKVLSDTYKNAWSADDTGVALVVVHGINYDSYENILLDSKTGQELWKNQDEALACVYGSDSQYIWGNDTGCDGAAGPETRFIVLDRKTGEAVDANAPDNTVSAYRTPNGFIFETYEYRDDEASNELKAVVADKDKTFKSLWKITPEFSYFFEYQNRIYAMVSHDGGNYIKGYLGYES